MPLAPTLIIQLQRMGDLIMTFPLISHLTHLEPQRPVWLLAEPRFFRELMPLTPEGVVYMGPDMVEPLARTPLHRVINLSHRPDALALAGRLAPLAEEGVNGAFADKGVLHTRGPWALYRQSIVHNNRHNRFHWADLHDLGLITPERLMEPAWPLPGGPNEHGQVHQTGPGGKIGLFVGASEPDKRPEAVFWGELARRLFKRGLNPVFLGGPDDRALAHEANVCSGLPGHNNLAGQFSLSSLTAFVRTLDLVISPDTGPMHLAAWAGVPVLNLSMGPVNPWETGPVPPGHFVLRPTPSCAGCWHCSRGNLCRQNFLPGRVATLTAALVRGEAPPRFQMPGLTLCRTGRTGGLYDLVSADAALPPVPGAHHAPPSARATNPALPSPRQARDLLDRFWQAWFLSALGGAPSPALAPETAPRHGQAAAWAGQLTALPRLHPVLQKAVSRISTRLAHALRRGGAPLDNEFWSAVPPLARPLAGYVHLVLQNGEFRRAAWEDALDLTAHLTATLAGDEPDQPVTCRTL